MEVGRYDDAREAVAGDGGVAASPELENVLGETFYLVGLRQEAEAAFRRAMDGGASDRNVARLNLGVLMWDRGDREEALVLFDSFIDLYNRSRDRLTAEEFMAVGTAVRYLGVTNPALYLDALLAFDDAAEVAPDDLRPDLLAGELFLEKYRATDARESFKPVLERNPRHPRALLGQARILDFEGIGGSVDLVRQALEVNPRYVEARAFLASLYLKTEDYELARDEAEKGLEINPAHLEALSVLAASYYLAGDMSAYREVRDRVQTLNPIYPDLFTTVAEAAVSQRQYQTAVALAQQAVALDSSSWWSYGVLGMNQMRTGAVEEGRRNLETAFAGDPYNPWYKNTLDLLDTFEHYRRIPTEHFEIFIHEREADLLGPYAAVTAEEAFSALQERYGAVPPIPIRLEIYPSHSDFSVRTLGLTGLGALGVSFGSTLVMDSPSALEPGSFNWASTLWHEASHAFHLAMTDHRVPRWFTEGLAVHEQHMARPYWGHRASPSWLQAYQAGRLNPVSELNEGFIRPEYPEQVVFSYYQASLVFDLIESRWGLDAILAMMDGYRKGISNAQVFQEVLGESPEAFDKTFDEYVRDRWGDEMQAVVFSSEEEAGRAAHQGSGDLETLRLRSAGNPGNFQARLSYGRALFLEERFDEAEVELRAALSLFPEYGGEDGPYLYLAGIHRERGELERAARALQQAGLLSETLYSVRSQEAELWLELGNTEGAARALEKVVEIAPFELGVHQELAELYEEIEEPRGAVLERMAILALDPTDRAEAHFRLAVAMAKAGDRAGARSQVLRALEIAPTYEAALELLLDLRGGGQGDGRVNEEEKPVIGRIR
jgi:tetratricopeptide (TPR) repeat protein